MLLSTVYLILLTNRVTLLLACESHHNGNDSNEEYFPDLETMPPVIESQNASDILKTLFQNYDKRLRPRHAGEPLSIAVSLGFLSISNIEEENMEFTVDIYMRQIWNDTRLAFADRGSTLVLQDEALDNLWLPDTFFENAVHTFVQKETRTVVLFGDGLVVFSQRITVRATTLMDFRAYPMDKQVFKLDIMSYGRSIDQLHYPRIDVQLLNSEMSEFVVVNQSVEITAKQLFMGCFDVLTVKFNLKRRVGYYVIRIYFPCTLCTVISWMAFWMDCRNIGDRGTVGITSLLTQLFLVGSINDSMPHVSYVKAADLFLIVSFVFSFLALLESLIVFKAASREKSTNKVLPLEEKENETDIRMNDLTKQGEMACPNKKADKKKRFSILQQPAGLTIDCFARAIFPLGYTVFIISYVSVYTI